MASGRNPEPRAGVGIASDPGKGREKQTRTDEVGAGEMSEEEIDRNLIGSFPASDPPSWTLGIGDPDAEAGEDEAGDGVEDGYIEPEARETAAYGVKEQQSS